MASTTGKPTAVLVLPPLLPSLGGTTTMADGELHHSSSSSRNKESPAHNDGDTLVSLCETLPTQTKNTSRSQRGASTLAAGDDAAVGILHQGGATSPSLKRRRSHFLRGIEIADCDDLLSIPDPPTPPPPLRTAPLRDLSNDDPHSTSRSTSPMGKRNPTASPAMHLSQNAEEPSKRVRLSLSIAASSVLSEKQVLDNQAVGEDKAKEQQQQQQQQPPQVEDLLEKNMQDDLDDDHNDDDDEEALLPPTLPSEQDKGVTTFQTFKSSGEDALIYRIPKQPDTQGLQELRKLVHAYTLIPEKERFESKEAQEIEKLSGYPLVPAFIPDDSVTSSGKNLRRRRIIDDLTNRMMSCDDCKHRDVKLMQSVTQCSARKIRGGYVEYQHIPTGRDVTPEEFEARYLCMIDEVSAVRSQSWGAYFARLAQEIKASDGSGQAPCVTEASAEENQQANNNNEASLEKESDLEKESVESVAHAHSYADDEEYFRDVIYKKVDATQINPSQHANATSTTPLKASQRPPSPTSPDMLLPFPSRDNPSQDAMIARAEKKLWNRIDAALKEYSKEVLEIQAAAAHHAE